MNAREASAKYPNFFKAVIMLNGQGSNCALVPNATFNIPDSYIPDLEKAEKVCADLYGKTLVDVLTTDELKEFHLERESDMNALEEVVIGGEYMASLAILAKYGDAGETVGKLLDQSYDDGELVGMVTS